MTGYPILQHTRPDQPLSQPCILTVLAAGPTFFPEIVLVAGVTFLMMVVLATGSLLLDEGDDGPRDDAIPQLHFTDPPHLGRLPPDAAAVKGNSYVRSSGRMLDHTRRESSLCIFP